MLYLLFFFFTVTAIHFQIFPLVVAADRFRLENQVLNRLACNRFLSSIERIKNLLIRFGIVTPSSVRYSLPFLNNIIYKPIQLLHLCTEISSSLYIFKAELLQLKQYTDNKNASCFTNMIGIYKIFTTNGHLM